MIDSINKKQITTNMNNSINQNLKAPNKMADITKKSSNIIMAILREQKAEADINHRMVVAEVAEEELEVAIVHKNQSSLFIE